MDETLRQLEDRVQRAAAEIRSLRRRHRELEAELAELRAASGQGSVEPAVAAWGDERRRIAAALRDAVGELRGE